MTDTCALHLSYVLESHPLPEQLLPYVPSAKSGSTAQKLEASDTASGCKGIVYLSNAKLGNAGLKVLEMAELARRGGEDEFGLDDQSPSRISSMASSRYQKPSDASYSPVSARSQGTRRSTVSSGSFSPPSYTGTTSNINHELDRARSRIQGSALRDGGPHCIELWSASLKMLSIARQILSDERKGRSEDQITRDDGISSDPAVPSKAEATYASKLMIDTSVSGEPILAITGVSTSPTTPTILRNRNGSTVITPASSRHTPSLDNSLQISPISLVINTSSDESELPYGLPGALWRRIITEASGAMGVVSDEQQKSIMAWARNRSTLGREREVLGKSESGQIWRVLDGMGCLSYDIPT